MLATDIIKSKDTPKKFPNPRKSVVNTSRIETDKTIHYDFRRRTSTTF